MRYLVLLLVLALSACASPGLKPTVFTSPQAYLAQFPVDQISEADLVRQAGPATRVSDIEGHRALVYEVGEGYGLRTYSYIIDAGKVADVLYNDNGPLNGTSAKGAQ